MSVKCVDEDLQSLADQFESFGLGFKLLVSDNFRYTNKEFGTFIKKNYILQLVESKDFILQKYIKLELNEDRGKFSFAVLNFGFPGMQKIGARNRTKFKKEIISILKKYDIVSYNANYSGSTFRCQVYGDTDLHGLINEIFNS